MIYAKKVKEKKWDFPTFTECCPICHGEDCAVRIGYYKRYVLDISEEIYIKIPIARYKCRRKKKPIVKDITFSLLPDNLIPYYSPTIDTFMYIISHKLIHKDSNIKILDYLYTYIPDVLFNLCERSLLRYYRLFYQSVVKLKQFFKRKDSNFSHIQRFSQSEFVNFINTFTSPGEEGAGAVFLSDFYYRELGSYLYNARFLFGTGYQFR